MGTGRSIVFTVHFTAFWLLFPIGMSDFQYLAMHSGPDGKQTSMYDKVLMLKPEKEEFFNRELPLYIPPPIFSRLDTPVDYYYRPDVQHRSVPFLIINNPRCFLNGKAVTHLSSLICTSNRPVFKLRYHFHHMGMNQIHSDISAVVGSMLLKHQASIKYMAHALH